MFKHSKGSMHQTKERDTTVDHSLEMRNTKHNQTSESQALIQARGLKGQSTRSFSSNKGAIQDSPGLRKSKASKVVTPQRTPVRRHEDYQNNSSRQANS